MKFAFLFLVAVCLLPGMKSLMCYWCSGVGNDRDCERKPLGIKSGPSNVNCSSKFCTTAKVMDLDHGDVKSFARFCDNVYRGNRCVKDTKLMTCYQACVYDHCNNGNPSPNYLRVENLLQPDPDAKKILDNEVSTDSEFHFFTAPPVNQVVEEKAPNVFKEQSIFKAFTTAGPSSTPLLETSPESSTPPPTTDVTDGTTVTMPDGEDPGGQGSTVSPDSSPRDQSISSVAGRGDVNTTGQSSTQPPPASEQTTGDPSSGPTLPPDTDTDTDRDDPGKENQVDDLGSVLPVDGPGQLQPIPETLPPEHVKEDFPLNPDPQPNLPDGVYTTPRPSTSTSTTPGLELNIDNDIEQNNTQTEELNLAATQNATATSGTESLQSICIYLAVVSLLSHGL